MEACSTCKQSSEGAESVREVEQCHSSHHIRQVAPHLWGYSLQLHTLASVAS